jgi:hypothetical protein
VRILYAAGNRPNAFFQMKRFIDTAKTHTFKLAAYKKSSGNITIDYTLDALLNFSGSTNISFNGNFSYYCKEIERFAPDLIISDFEIYTSVYAIEHNIPIWQVSPVLLYYALPNDIKYNLNINKYYGYLFNGDHRQKDYINFILNNSNKKLVYSHICDIQDVPQLNNNFEWVRPDFISGNNKSQFEYLCVMQNNKNIIDQLKNKNAIYFTDFTNEFYNKLILQSVYDSTTYAGSLSNASTFIYDGGATFAADAFYNSKYSVAEPILTDTESIIVSYTNRYFGLSEMFKDYEGIKKDINISLNNDIKCLWKLL